MFIQWVADGIKCSLLKSRSDALVACPYATIVRTDWQPVADIVTSWPHPAFALSSAPSTEIVFGGDQTIKN